MMTAVMSLATIFAAFTIALRWFVDYQGSILQLTLLVASLAGASLLVARANCTRWWEFSFDCTFTALVMISIWVWSPVFTLSVALSLPLLAVTGLRLWLQITGVQIAILGTGAARSTSQSQQGLQDESNHALGEDANSCAMIGETDSPPSAIPGVAVESEQMDSDLESEQNPWQFVQDQFSIDDSLVQNVAHWQDQDGSRCVVANMRCRFSQSSEIRVLHLPFWPLMSSDPQVFCRVTEGGPATIKATQVAPHGIRVEVQLNVEDAKSRTPCDVLVEIMASQEADSSECAA